jgi:hypothetical protein
MKMTHITKSLLLASVAATTLLGGCVVRGTVAVPAPVYVGGVVTVAPPPPQVEAIGVPPQAGFVWIGGYWNWVGGQHVWVAGRWVEPRPGYHWVAHSWIRVGGGWRLQEGYWARR